MIQKLKFLLIAIIASHTLNSFASRALNQPDSLSPSSYIALLTCDPGNQLYSTFGHSAIGVVDPEQNMAIVFNYGTFSFNVPFFYAKFASGKLMYTLSVTSYKRFLREYQYEKRRVIEDKLNLNQQQQQRLFSLLLENYKPENRDYQYDFFFDNCATRIIDIFYKALGDTLVYIPAENAAVKTHRNLLTEYLKNKYWSDFGINLALGEVVDHPATEMEKTFIPDYLAAYVDFCVINGQPFVKNSRILVKDTETLKATPWIIRPATIFWFFLIIVSLLTIQFRKRAWIIGDRIIFGVLGFFGLVIFLMWTATEHDGMANNLNVIWLNPLYLIFVWLIGNKHHKILKWCAFSILGLNAIVILGWNILPQQFHIAYIPIIGIIMLRSGVIALRSWK